MRHPLPRCNVLVESRLTARVPANPTPSLLALKPTGRYFATAKPESATAFSRSAGFVLVSSYFTTTWLFSRSAEADSTPLTCLSLASVFAGHFSHFQPLTLMVSVFTFARAAVLEASAIANTSDEVFMCSPSGEKAARTYRAAGRRWQWCDARPASQIERAAPWCRT